MKLSYNWLCDYVDLSGLSPKDAAERLTMGAFEVEEVETVGPELVGPVVVGEIIEISKHPNADKIRLTKVKIGKDSEPLEIVCGAQNIEVGQRIPVALPGSVVLNRKTGEKLPIKRAPIRGVHSNGMLCSPPELGITGEGEGILILSRPGENGVELGTDLIEHMSLKPDYILNVAPRSNRGDALSVIGLAREVAALTNRPFKFPEWKLSHLGSSNADEKSSSEQIYQDADENSGFATRIESLDDCHYFSTRLIENVTIGPSPYWLKRRLESLGLRTVNNVVDITNYIMLEFGQPLHAYDITRLAGNALFVRRAGNGEKIVSIDGKVRELNEEVLVITDRSQVVGIAGIMGGKDSEISDETKNIALEAASFNPKRVRRGSRLLGLSSDSSLRFERGVDLQSVKTASDRATYLLAKYGGANVRVKSFYQSGSAELPPIWLSMRLFQVKRYLDFDLTADQALEYLESLGFTNPKLSVCVSPGLTDEVISVEVPSFRRADVTREIDLIEEVCRLHGYNNLTETMPETTGCPQPRDSLLNDVRRALSAQGLSEAWISSLRSETELASIESSSLVKVLNPLSSDHQVMRQSLIPGLIAAVKYNQDHGNKDVWLFETGRAYKRVHYDLGDGNLLEDPVEDQSSLVASKSTEDLHGTGVSEHHLAAGVITGSQIKQVVSSKKENDNVINQPAMQEVVDFFRMKGIVENLLECCGVSVHDVRFFKPKEHPEVFHPHRFAQVAVVRRPGVLSPKIGTVEGDKRAADKSIRGSEWPRVPGAEADLIRSVPSPSVPSAPPLISGGLERAGADLTGAESNKLIKLGYLGELHPFLVQEKELRDRAFAFELDLDLLSACRTRKAFFELATTPLVARDLTVDLPIHIEQSAVRSLIETQAGEWLVDIELVSIYTLDEANRSLSYRLTFQEKTRTLTNEEIDARLNFVRQALIDKLGGHFRA